jgi:hypothetical protein
MVTVAPGTADETAIRRKELSGPQCPTSVMVLGPEVDSGAVSAMVAEFSRLPLWKVRCLWWRTMTHDSYLRRLPRAALIVPAGLICIGLVAGCGDEEEGETVLNGENPAATTSDADATTGILDQVDQGASGLGADLKDRLTGLADDLTQAATEAKDGAEEETAGALDTVTDLAGELKTAVSEGKLQDIAGHFATLNGMKDNLPASVQSVIDSIGDALPENIKGMMDQGEGLLEQGRGLLGGGE